MMHPLYLKVILVFYSMFGNIYNLLFDQWCVGLTARHGMTHLLTSAIRHQTSEKGLIELYKPARGHVSIDPRCFVFHPVYHCSQYFLVAYHRLAQLASPHTAFESNRCSGYLDLGH